MNTASQSVRIEAAQILKQANWSYEYCRPETVRESVMSEHISEIENGLRDISEEDLAEKISKELHYNIDDVNLEDAQEVAKFVAHDIALYFVVDYSYETVTFKIS